MASIPGFRFDITGQSGSAAFLSPKDSWRVYVFPRGGYAAQDSTGTVITFDSASVASRFAVNNWIQAGLLTANIRQVGAVGGNSISISGAALTVSENMRIFLIGNTEPTVTGGSATYVTPNTVVRQRDDDAADLYTNSMITTNADGLAQGFCDPGLYDVLIQDGNRANQGSVVELVVGISTDYAATFGATASFIAGASFGSTTTFGYSVTMLQGLSIAQALRVAYNTLAAGQDVASRFGIRAQTTGISGEKYLVYASESYTSDLAAANETFALYGINQISGAIASGADAHAVTGEVQFVPTDAKDATGAIVGVQGIARYSGTHANATASQLNGAAFSAVVSAGSTGTITNLRSLLVNAPTSGGTVAITNAIALSVIGPAPGVGATQNNVAYFSCAADEDSNVIFNGCKLRINDLDNFSGAPTAGRWVDIHRDWDGADSGSPLYIGLHVTVNAEGTFTAQDDIYGARSVTRTGTAAGDGTNLDIVGAFEGVVDHRSSATIDELYGIDLRADHSAGAGIVTTQAGLRALPSVTAGQTTSNVYGGVFNSVKPIAGHSSCGHLRLTPVSSATPSTTLALLTGAAAGSIIYIEDAAGQSNSGFFFRVANQWRRLDDTVLSVPTD